MKLRFTLYNRESFTAKSWNGIVLQGNAILDGSVTQATGSVLVSPARSATREDTKQAMLCCFTEDQLLSQPTTFEVLHPLITILMKLKTHLSRTHLSWSASVSFCMYHSGGVCVCVCVCVCVWSLVFMVWVIFLHVDTVSGLYGCFFMLSWMFQHDYIDTCCFECLICMCFVFLYLHLFSAIEHVSHGKVL